jgi:hypothetical protein
MSLALYGQFLTVRNKRLGYHKALESMSEAQQLILKNGLRDLIGIGIAKDESKVSTYGGTNVKQWVTLADFKSMFPDTLKFTFKYKALGEKDAHTYSLSLYQVWDTFYGNLLSYDQFDDKLFTINAKIQAYKDALKNRENPHLALLEVFYPKASERFLDLAKSFSILLMNLIDNNLFTGTHSHTDLITPWHINLMRIVFGL